MISPSISIVNSKPSPCLARKIISIRSISLLKITKSKCLAMTRITTVPWLTRSSMTLRELGSFKRAIAKWSGRQTRTQNMESIRFKWLARAHKALSILYLTRLQSSEIAQRRCSLHPLSIIKLTWSTIRPLSMCFQSLEILSQCIALLNTPQLSITPRPGYSGTRMVLTCAGWTGIPLIVRRKVCMRLLSPQ